MLYNLYNDYKLSRDSYLTFFFNIIFLRVSAMLRQMAQYHARNSHHLFMVRVSQGLVHMGKGTLSLAPFHTDRQILNPVSLGALLALLVTCLDVKSTLLNKVIIIIIFFLKII